MKHGSVDRYPVFFHMARLKEGAYPPEMKLAEALSQRSSLQKDLSWIKDQFSKIARVPEGSRPAEDPEEMLKRMDSRTAEYQALLTAINRTNANARDEKGRTLTDLLAERDTLRARQSILAEAYQQATQKDDVFGRQELRHVPTLDVVALRRRLEQESTRLRELNMSIQRLNWEVDLEE